MAATMLFPDGLVFDISGDSQLVATHGDLIEKLCDMVLDVCPVDQTWARNPQFETAHNLIG